MSSSLCRVLIDLETKIREISTVPTEDFHVEIKVDETTFENIIYSLVSKETYKLYVPIEFEKLKTTGIRIYGVLFTVKESQSN